VDIALAVGLVVGEAGRGVRRGAVSEGCRAVDVGRRFVGAAGRGLDVGRNVDVNCGSGVAVYTMMIGYAVGIIVGVGVGVRAHPISIIPQHIMIALRALSCTFLPRYRVSHPSPEYIT